MLSKIFKIKGEDFFLFVIYMYNKRNKYCTINPIL